MIYAGLCLIPAGVILMILIFDTVRSQRNRKQNIFENRIIYKGCPPREALRKWREENRLYFRQPLGWGNSSMIENDLKKAILRSLPQNTFSVAILTLSGSRVRGLEKKKSDLNVLFFYNSHHYDSVFMPVLHSNHYKYNGVHVKITAIRVSSSRDRKISKVLEAEECRLYYKALSQRAAAEFVKYYTNRLEMLLSVSPLKIAKCIENDAFKNGHAHYWVEALKHIAENESVSTETVRWLIQELDKVAEGQISEGTLGLPVSEKAA